MFQSKLPHVGTTIFTVMSQLAAKHGAVNLGQGFPDFEGPDALHAGIEKHRRLGRNQYAPMTGVAALRQEIARKIGDLYGRNVDPDSEVTVTSGATEALYAAIAAVVHPGEEVILLDPCYDSYEPAVLLNGGVPVHVPLTDGSFRLDHERLAAAITPKTRLIVLNTPHNPSGATLTADDLAFLRELVARYDLYLLGDEVYEHILFDGRVHQSLLRDEALYARSFVVSSFGKTFHVTGWKVGTVAAPAPLSAEFRKVHQFNVFTVNTPVQHGLARYLADPAPYLGLPAFYQRKRDLFRAGLAASRLRLLPSEGSYFQLVDYSAVSDLDEVAFCRWLTTGIGVAAIPLSVFYDGGFEQKLARLCFAKRDETLERALERLARL